MSEIYPVTLMGYMLTKYKDGARGENGLYDCWGLARHVRHFVYGKSLLSEFAGVDRFVPKSLAKSCKEQIKTLKEIKTPVAGAVVAVYKKGLCVHVAVCVENNGEIEIMDTNPATNTQVFSIPRFIRPYGECEIKYYD